MCPRATLDAKTQADQSQPLEKKRVLIVEDEFLLGFSLREDLCEAGADVTGPLSTIGEALEAVSSEPFDIVLLDINLRGEMSFAVADELLAKNVPFVFLTGYHSEVVPERFRPLPRLAKPHDPKGLAGFVARFAR